MNASMPTVPDVTRFVVLAAVDDTPMASVVVSTAAALTRGHPGGELHLVHVLDHTASGSSAIVHPPNGRLETGGAVLRAQAAALPDAGRNVRLHLVLGTPAREILQLATDLHADLVVVGTHDDRGIDRLLLGSVSEPVTKRASCPVMVVRLKSYPAVKAVEIEPACPQCLSMQSATQGMKLWCERHTERHPHSHLHYEYPEPFAVGSTLLRP